MPPLKIVTGNLYAMLHFTKYAASCNGKVLHFVMEIPNDYSCL